MNTCNTEPMDAFVKYLEIYEKKRNDLVELYDLFNVEDVDYKYDYLITFDLKAMSQKKRNKRGRKIKLCCTTYSSFSINFDKCSLV